MLSPADGVVEEWIAAPGGGFQRATYDMPQLLSEASLCHLYDRLCAEDLSLLWMTFEKLGRESFLVFLKDDLGLSKLSDRQVGC